MKDLTAKRVQLIDLEKRMNKIIKLSRRSNKFNLPWIENWVEEANELFEEKYDTYPHESFFDFKWFNEKEYLFDILTYVRRALKEEGIISQKFLKLKTIKAQKRKAFFEIRDRLAKVEKRFDLIDLSERVLVADFWMDDILFVARKYGEVALENNSLEYKEDHFSRKIRFACFLLVSLFKKEGWDLGILQKYAESGLYESADDEKTEDELLDYYSEKLKNQGLDMYSVIRQLKKRGLVNCIIL